MSKTVFVTAFTALWLKNHRAEAGYITISDLRYAGVTGSLCVTTGAKLGYHPENGWYVSGYAADGSDVNSLFLGGEDGRYEPPMPWFPTDAEWREYTNYSVRFM